MTGKAQSALVTTKPEEEFEDSLICDGGATWPLTKNLENCSLYKLKDLENCTLCKLLHKPKVVINQMAHVSTMMNSTHLRHRTYHICDRLVLPVIVKVFVVPGLKHDL